MSVCQFSEFSFGYALTHSLTKAFSGVLGKAPVFPSLIQEGSSGGGYDVKLPLVPFPVFLQFKIPLVLKRSSSLRPSLYPLPYYRIPLRTKQPNQHQMLLDLELKEPLVFYAAPFFHELTDLDHTFVSSQVQHKTIYIKPSKIGPLDDKSHHLSYHPSATIYWLRSDPKAIDGDFSFHNFTHLIGHRRDNLREELKLPARSIGTNEANDRQRELFRNLRNRLLEIESGADALTTALPDVYEIENVDPSEMARRISYVAQVRFGLTLALVDAAET